MRIEFNFDDDCLISRVNVGTLTALTKRRQLKMWQAIGNKAEREKLRLFESIVKKGDVGC